MSHQGQWDAIVPILVAVYVTGLVAGEYIRMSITWVTEQVSRLGVAATSTEEVETEPGSDSFFHIHHFFSTIC